MDANYRTLTAALALNEFTVNALADEAAAKPTTVRTILNRNRNFFEITVASSGRRGGQPQVWAVLDEARDQLSRVVEAIDDRFKGQQVLPVKLSQSGELTSPSSLRLRTPSANPEIVTADDLDHFDLQSSERLLPEIVMRLLLATPGLTGMSMRVGEGVILPSFDGRIEAVANAPYVPDGPSVWELGASKHPRGKAQADLTKRTNNSDGIEPCETSFVFVSIRRFNDKEEWLKRSGAKHVWRHIQVIDADDLYGWLLSTPEVHIWLSEQMGLHPADVTTLKNWLDPWLRQTEPSLPAKVLLAGRRDAARTLRETVARDGQTISIYSNSREESIAFTAAALLGEATEVETRADTAKLASALIVKTPREWTRLVATLSNSILVPDFEDPDIASAIGRGLSVVTPMGIVDNPRRATIVLPRISHSEAVEELTKSGFSLDEADKAAREIDRSLTSFRRARAASSVYRRPDWSNQAAALLAPLVLVGSWKVDSDSDREIVSRVVGLPYSVIDQKLRVLAAREDPPFILSGQNWQLVSPQDSFDLLESVLTEQVLDQWQAAAADVLGEHDPMLEVTPAQDVTAAIRGVQRQYSQALRNGIARGATLLGVLGGRGGNSGLLLSGYASRLVGDLLGQASDGRAWVSLSDVLPLLAEAAPDEFLQAATDGAVGEHPILLAMFRDQGLPPVFGGGSPHTGLLWALELLCNLEDYAPEACRILARLAEVDPGGRLSNRPFESLRCVLLPWYPQIAVAGEERLKIVEHILKSNQAVGWRLVLGLLPASYDSSNATYKPTLRPSKIGTSTSIGDRVLAWQSLVTMAIEIVRCDVAKWATFLESVTLLSPIDRKRCLDELEAVTVGNIESGTRLLVWRTLSAFTSKHRQFPGAQWVLPDPEIERLEIISRAWEPIDPSERHAWLFSQHPNLSNPNKYLDQGAYQRELAALRQGALREVLSVESTDALNRLIEESSDAFSVGYTLAEVFGMAYLPEMLDAFEAGGSRVQAARGWLFNMAQLQDQEWLSAFIKQTNGLSDGVRLNVYHSLEHRAEILNAVRGESTDVQDQFWADVNYMFLTSEHAEEIATGLLDHGTPRKAIGYLAVVCRKQPVPHELALRALHAATEVRSHDAILDGMAAHDVGRLLDHLESTGAEGATLAELELLYFGILQYTRPARALFEKLEHSPEFFAELICGVFRASNDPPSVLQPEKAVRARVSYSVLHEWRRPPGSRDDGSIDSSILRPWINRVRKYLEDKDRVDIGDECIGELLSGAVAGADGIWPPEPVRDLLEEISTKHLRAGLEIGQFNSRGVTTRGAFDGGLQEAELAAQYESWSRKVAARWPATGRLLREMSKSYKTWANRQDAMAEQWRDAR